MDTIETGGLHGYQKIFELGISFQYSEDHSLHLFHTADGIRNRLHVDKSVGIEVHSSDVVVARSDIKPYT